MRKFIKDNNVTDSHKTCQQHISGLTRISLGFILLWAFFDKLLGLGMNTALEKSWLAGTSPTLGFLKLATKGPLAGFYQNLAGNVVVDWLFMMGLLLIGLALILGVGMKIATYSGSLLMFLMWSASFPPKTNPLIDQHIIYILVLLGLNATKAGEHLGFGKWWSNTGIVKKFPILE